MKKIKISHQVKELKIRVKDELKLSIHNYIPQSYYKTNNMEYQKENVK
jgi:hypothetical protein